MARVSSCAAQPIYIYIYNFSFTNDVTLLKLCSMLFPVAIIGGGGGGGGRTIGSAFKPTWGQPYNRKCPNYTISLHIPTALHYRGLQNVCNSEAELIVVR